MKKSLVFFWLLLVLVAPLPGLAQVPSITFEHIQKKDGLPSSTVFYATKDKKGFMWFGTRKCPTRFDGYSFRNFTDMETGMVLGIASDNENNLYFATNFARICKLESNTFQMAILPGAHDKPSKQTAHIFIDSKGNGWYSDWYGVNKIDLTTNVSKHYGFRPTSYIWVKASFAEDHNGTIWIMGSDNGLFRYDPEADTITCVLGADAVDEARRLPILFSQGYVDKEGFLWIGTHNYGLIKYNVLDDSFRVLTTGLNKKNTQAIEEGLDENGNRIIWFGHNEGLGIFRPDQERFYYFENILPTPFAVNHIYRDKELGIVWISTSEGILKYHPQSNLIQSFFLPQELVRFPVTVKYFINDNQDPTGESVYIGLSHTGILNWKRSENSYKLIPFPPGESAAEVKWMIQKDDGKLWIGTNKWNYTRPGIFIYDPKTGRYLQDHQSEEANRYFSVPFFMYGAFDKGSRLWIGNSDEGVHVITPEGKEVTPIDSVLQNTILIKGNNLINDILLDAQGKLWLGTYEGLFYMDEDDKKFVNTDLIFDNDVPQDLAINSIFQDSKGNIWAARWGSITRSGPDGKLNLSLLVTDGLFDRENKGIAEDKNGNFWFGNYDGLHHYNVKSKKLTGFTMNEGLINNNTLDRVFVLQGNQLYIGMQNGFNILNTDKVYSSSATGIIEISSLKVQGKPRDQDFSIPIILSREENSFNVEFATLNYSKIQGSHYAYYLEGIDRDWQYNEQLNLATYTNLGPGNYVLHVKTGDAFDNWIEHPQLLQIKVLPAYYETLWFRISLIIFLIMILLGLYHYRVNQILRLQRVRNRISSDLHDEIGSSLSGISIMGVIARNNLQNQHPSEPFIQKILEETNQISTSLDDIVWSINPQNDELSNLIARMTRYASEMLEAKEIRHTMNIPNQLDHVKLSMEQRRDFYLIFKEAINNLVKYSKCRNASFDVFVKGKRLYLNIEDDGQGFDPDVATDRNGIKNMRRRAANLKGRIRIASALQKGTRISLDFPL